MLATKNTTRVAGADPVADAAGVALAVFPSAAPGTHPTAVTLAPTDDWQAAIAASVLMAPPIRAPVLLSGSGSLPAATSDALTTLAPTGSGPAGGAQVIRVGAVPTVKGLHAARSAAATRTRWRRGSTGSSSGRRPAERRRGDRLGHDPAYAMPAAGWAAESGDPVLFVGASGVPAATRQALLAHSKPHIYVLGPSNVIPDATMTQLGKYGTVKRVGGADPAANSVAFAIYRDPACAFGQPCAHVPGSFGWAMRSPGHGYVLLNASRAARRRRRGRRCRAAATTVPACWWTMPLPFPSAVLNYFLDYATPGYTQEGPTAAVYNHGWVIGDPSAISVAVQAEMDRLLRLQPVLAEGQDNEPGRASRPATSRTTR